MINNNHRLNQRFAADFLPCDNSCDKMTQFKALLIINQSQQKKGQFNPAILDEAQKIFNSMETDSPMQIEALRNLVVAFSKAGRYDEANNLWQKLNNNPVVKAKELRELGAVLIATGDIFADDAVSVFTKAEKFTREIKHAQTKVETLRELAKVLAQTRYIHKSLALMEECEILSREN
jgi:tetratricopeptide (TPR) repeat protein